MKIKTSPFLRKTFWLLLTVFLVLAQLAYAAELTEEELQAMPTVSITYYIAEGGEAMALDAVPTLNSLGKAYWAMLPSEAFSFPMTLNITASETAPYTFSPANGETLITDVTHRRLRRHIHNDYRLSKRRGGRYLLAVYLHSGDAPDRGADSRAYNRADTRDDTNAHAFTNTYT